MISLGRFCSSVFFPTSTLFFQANKQTASSDMTVKAIKRKWQQIRVGKGDENIEYE
jgi:hypothetical protein